MLIPNPQEGGCQGSAALSVCAGPQVSPMFQLQGRVHDSDCAWWRQQSTEQGNVVSRGSSNNLGSQEWDHFPQCFQLERCCSLSKSAFNHAQHHSNVSFAAPVPETDYFH